MEAPHTAATDWVSSASSHGSASSTLFVTAVCILATSRAANHRASYAQIERQLSFPIEGESFCAPFFKVHRGVARIRSAVTMVSEQVSFLLQLEQSVKAQQ